MAESDDDRDAILTRRRGWIAKALAGLAVSTTLGACVVPEPCLRVAIDAGTDAGEDAGPPGDAGTGDGG